MRRATRLCLAGWALWAALGMGVRAQNPGSDEKPAPFKPLHPQNPEELARREARKLYGLGEMCLRQDRLVEATRIFEEALKLDAEAAPLHKVLVPLYIALNRTDDALEECRKTLALDPEDYETWSLYARQWKSQGQLKKAAQALERALACRGLADHLDLRLQWLFELGRLSEETENYDRAVTAFGDLVKFLNSPQTALEIDGADRESLKSQAADTYERMIRICIKAQHYELALSIFEEANKRFPQLVRRLNFHLAKVEFAQGRAAEALVHLDDYLNTQPQGTEAHELRIAILKRLGRESEIVPSLEEYSRQDSFNVALRLLLAREYARAGQTRDARDVYEKLAEQSPTADVYRGLFKLWKDAGEMHDALEHLNDALARSEKNNNREGDSQSAAKARAMLLALREDPELARAMVPAGLRALEGGAALDGQTLGFLAVFASRTRQLAEAESFYRRCLDDHPNPQQEHAYYKGLIDVLWKAHKHEALAEVCRQGLRRAQATNYLMFHRHLSEALAFLGKADEAVEEADKAVEIADERNRSSMRLYRLYVLDRLERYPQALAEAHAMLKEYSEPSQVRSIRFRLSTIYSSMRDHARAEEQMLLILKADPNDAGANNDLGYMWADQGKNLPEAERLIRKAIALDAEQRKGSKAIDDDGGNAAYYDSLGWVLFRRGQIEGAREWLEKAASLSAAEEDPTIWDHLGDVYFRLDNKAGARSAWQKSVHLYDTSKQRKADDHYKELKHKLQLLDSEARQ